MLRILLYVAALICLFGGAIVYGGNAIGAWDALPPAPQPPPAVKIEHTKAKSAARPAKHASHEARRTPAQKEWIRQADAVCGDSKTDVEEVAAQGRPTTAAGAIALFHRVKTLNAKLNDRFLALGAPPGYKDDIARIRLLFAKEERYFDSMEAALRRGDQTTFYALADRLTGIALDESDILANLGAYDCDADLLPAFSS